MTTKQWLKIEFMPIPLIALMVLTRFHHFGDVLHLPDASLAVFFFAGFFRASACSKPAFFVFLLLLAGLIDTVAIANGTSAWCVSPAYIFLLPTYAVMWYAGRYCSVFKSFNRVDMALALGLATLAASAAFVISNFSFYLFSGRYEELSLLDYGLRVVQYYPAYVGSTLLYTLTGLIMIRLFKALPILQTQHHEV